MLNNNYNDNNKKNCKGAFIHGFNTLVRKIKKE